MNSIKQIISKIDLDKIAKYSTEYPQSKTLRKIIRYSKRILDSKNNQEVFKLGTDLAYHLNAICDPYKANYYVKNEEEKKYWLEISEELFKNTIGAKK